MSSTMMSRTKIRLATLLAGTALLVITGTAPAQAATPCSFTITRADSSIVTSTHQTTKLAIDYAGDGCASIHKPFSFDWSSTDYQTFAPLTSKYTSRVLISDLPSTVSVPVPGFGQWNVTTPTYSPDANHLTYVTIAKAVIGAKRTGKSVHLSLKVSAFGEGLSLVSHTWEAYENGEWTGLYLTIRTGPSGTETFTSTLPKGTKFRVQIWSEGGLWTDGISNVVKS